MSQPHTSRDFESELREVRAQTVAMGVRCERALQLALSSFFAGEPHAADEVRELDAKIDRDEMEIDELVLRLLARRQPVALDLRFLTGTLRVVTDLERIGDEATAIAEWVEPVAGGGAHERVRADLRQMGERVRQLLRRALQSFEHDESADGPDLVDADQAVGDLYSRVVAGMTAFMADHGDQAADAVRVLHVAKYLERAADHATNIVEHVVFIVRGEDVRHTRSRPPPPPPPLAH